MTKLLRSTMAIVCDERVIVTFSISRKSLNLADNFR